MRSKLQIALGVALMMAGLWGGTYLLHASPWGHWANFPTFMTAVVLFFGGTVLAMAGASL